MNVTHDSTTNRHNPPESEVEQSETQNNKPKEVDGRKLITIFKCNYCGAKIIEYDTTTTQTTSIQVVLILYYSDKVYYCWECDNYHACEDCYTSPDFSHYDHPFFEEHGT